MKCIELSFSVFRLLLACFLILNVLLIAQIVFPIAEWNLYFRTLNVLHSIDLKVMPNPFYGL